MKRRPRRAARILTRASRQDLFFQGEAANLDGIAGFHEVGAETRSVERVETRAFDGPLLKSPVVVPLLERECDMGIDDIETADRAFDPDRLAEVEHADGV